VALIAIETSTASCGVAIMSTPVEGNASPDVLYECDEILERTHSRMLLPMIQRAMARTGLEARGVEAIAVSSGPGSFTGVRIGVATAKGLAVAWDVPVVTIGSLEVMAANAPEGSIACPVVDARRGLFYSCLYRIVSGPGTEELQPVGVYPLEEIVARAASSLQAHDQTGVRVVFMGDAVGRLEDKIVTLPRDRWVIAPAAMALPRSATLGYLAAAAWRRGTISSAEAALPTYVRRSDAEEKRESLLPGRVLGWRDWSSQR
jgi:tRNA threonylcarbamoyladenosine biosynthesis protein TsaB